MSYLTAVTSEDICQGPSVMVNRGTPRRISQNKLWGTW